MITETKAANAVGGKTARACDSCLCKRARWYCASDDAFLCQSCDSSVHSANQLASRHERVRLGTASFKATAANSPPACWHHGFTRKPRTQRQRKDKESVTANTSSVVPEMSSEEASNEDSEEQLLLRVPIFDSFDADLCNEFHRTNIGVGEVKGNNGEVEPCDYFDNLNGFLTSDMELAEFAADVESLLGAGLDEDSCGIENLGLMDCKEEERCFGGSRMKVEDEEVEAIISSSLDLTVDMTKEMLDWNFDYEEEKAVPIPETTTTTTTTTMMNVEIKEEEQQRKILLRLNYEQVITAWDNQRCPWTTGSRPEFNPNDCWPDFKGIYGGGVHQQYGSAGVRVDEGREARVSRYREKKRTRLFSKKIRYEVRKLNAEKRPRMKGRFVKRASFVGGTSFPHYILNK